MAATLSTLLLFGTSSPLYAATFQQGSAISLESDSQLTGQLTFKSDVKFYKLTTTDTSGVYISFQNVTAPIEAQLIDENGNQVAYMNTSLTTNKNMEARVSAGTYYLRVHSYNWDNSTHNGTYSINATYTSDGELGTLGNEIKDSAQTILVGTSHDETLTSNVDINYFKLTSLGSGDLYVKLENITAPLQVELLNVNNEKIAEVDTSGNQTKSFETKVNVGSYYLKVTASTWNDSVQNGSYSIMATYPTINIKHSDDFEPNDIKNHAYRIHPGTEYKKNNFTNVDQDYYKIQTDYNGQIKLDFYNTQNPVLVELLDENGNILGVSSTNKFAPVFVPKGTYYIKVIPFQWTDNEKGSYTFKASFFEDQKKITINVNSEPLSLDQPPFFLNGRTMVPLRGVLEALGAFVGWNNLTQTVTVIKDSNKIILPIGSKTATVNGKSVSLDIPAEVIKGRTMVPLRFLSEALNNQVDWDAENQAVDITTN